MAGQSFETSSTADPSLLPPNNPDSPLSPATSHTPHRPPPSSSSADQRRGTGSTSHADRKPRWLSHVQDWLSTSEPSAQALKEQRDKAHKRLGVDARDPRAAAKLGLPAGKIPRGATTSTTGPTPERALLQAARDRQQRRSYQSANHTSFSLSSHGSTCSSFREHNPVTPWDDR